MASAIFTKYLGPSNCKGSRIVATHGSARCEVGYQDALTSEENHRKAMEKLCKKAEIPTTGWVAGGHPSGDGYVFVLVKQWEQVPAKTPEGWCLMPTRATQAMRSAIEEWESTQNPSYFGWGKTFDQSAWEKVVQAAPSYTPPAPSYTPPATPTQDTTVPQEPTGWRLVPTTLTKGMSEAATDETGGDVFTQASWDFLLREAPRFTPQHSDDED